MTPSEADQRIIHSRRVLAGWIAVGAGGKPEDVMRMVNEEIAILENIAEEHPGKAAKLVRLVSEWVAFRERMRGTLH